MLLLSFASDSDVILLPSPPAATAQPPTQPKEDQPSTSRGPKRRSTHYNTACPAGWEAVVEEGARKGMKRGKLSRNKKGRGKSRVKKIKTFTDDSDLDDFQ